MGMSRFQQLNDVQILAVILYGKAKDKPREEKAALAMKLQENMQRGQKLYKYFCFCTSHPYFPRLYDIAGDFTRYMEKDRSLSECYDVSCSMIYGEIEPIRMMEAAQCPQSAKHLSR